MQILEYRIGDDDLLATIQQRVPESSALHCREFVNHYYGSADYCRLFAAVNNHGEPAAIMGMERMAFSVPGSILQLGFGTNAHGFRPGAFAILFRHFLRRCDYGLAFGGSDDMHNLLRRQHWTYFPSVPILRVNREWQSWPGERPWKRLVKAVARHLTPRVNLAKWTAKLLAGCNELRVQEEVSVTEDMLPYSSPFTFRFVPSIDHLNWRYQVGLPFVRYRVFRLVGNDCRGYVIVNQRASQLLIAQCDCDDPLILAKGILAAVRQIAQEGAVRHEVVVSTTHPVISGVLRACRFRRQHEDVPFAIGALRGTSKPPVPPHPVDWLINFDWGDNGLRFPHFSKVDRPR